MSIGFSYREELSGTYHWLDDPLVEKHAQMRLRVVGTSVPDAFRDRRLLVRGELDLEGFVSGAELTGSVGLKIRERRIPYDVEFFAEGQMLRLLGEKDLHPALVEDTLALLPLSIFDPKGYELGRARLRMPLLGGWLRALTSFRLRWFRGDGVPFDEVRDSFVR